MASLSRIAILLLLICCHCCAAQEAPPNFVIIMADDLGYGDLSCYDGWIKTPHIDRIAKDGLRFTDYHSSGAVCSPTRAGLLTGRYQQRAGIPGVIFADAKRPVHEHGLQPKEITFAELLKEKGYATATFGKWHLGYYPKYNPIRQGFDQFHGYVSGNIDFFSHVDQTGRFDWWQQDQLKDENGYVTHLITKHATRFIEEQKNKPFCLYLPHEAPHYPYQGPKDKPLRQVGKPRSKKETAMPKAQKKRAYREMVEEMDKSVGAVLQSLKKQGLEKRTLVLFISDNGATALGSNGNLRGHKGTVWEGGHRVPGIAYWPGKIKPGTNPSLTICLDVTPTILAIAGAKVPKGHQLDGIDLSPVLFEGKVIKDRKLFWQHGNSQAMRHGNWKLVQNARGAKGIRLFDLAKDRSEQNNLAKAQPERGTQMATELKSWQKEVTENATPQPEKGESR